MPLFYFDYVDHPSLQAWAYYDKPEHCGMIGMHTGAVLLVYDLFYRTLSHPQILKSIGNASAESDARTFSKLGIYGNYKRLEKARGKSLTLSDVMPRDPERREYAERLAKIAMEFFVLHEVSHVTYGHSEYFNDPKTPLFMEFSGGVSKRDPLVRQFTEIVADSHAALTSWIRRLQNADLSDRTRRGKLDKSPEIVVPDELFMFDWTFAIIYMFWLFDHDTDPKKIAASTHPPPLQRMELANTDIFRMLKKMAPPDAQEQWDRARTKAAIEANDSLGIFGSGQMLKKLRDYSKLKIDGMLDDHLTNIMDVGQKVKGDISKFSHHTHTP